MGGALAIFVKTPGHSPVKSRLAAERGERYAVDWYRQAAAAVASVARRAHARYGAVAYWAVAESDAHAAWPDMPAIAQGEGDLATRMWNVHAQLVARHGFGLLIGADTPQLTAAFLGEAVDWLSGASPRLVLGPARDGGFWLFGGNIVPPLRTWTSVRYSTADTARALRRAMHGLGDWHTLAALTDVDHASDLVEVRKALQQLPDSTPEQSALACWMHSWERERVPS